MSMRITILGCGSAGGVPMIGNTWGDCDPQEPRNRRLRASILVEQGETAVLIDTGPDLRQQCLNAGITRLAAVLYTHAHADHVHGIDDLRAVNRMQHETIDAWGTDETLDQIIKRFSYVFDPPGNFSSTSPRNSDVTINNPVFYKPCLIPREFQHDQPFDVNGIPVLPFAQDHGYMTTTGFRFGDFAYSTDVVELADAAFAALDGVKLWVVGCLQDKAHPTHAHLERVLEWIERVGPDRAVLTHLSHKMDYRRLADELPDHIVPAYDGMVLESASVVAPTPQITGARG